VPGLPYFRADSTHSLNLRSTFSASVALLVVLILPLYYVFVRYATGVEFECGFGAAMRICTFERRMFLVIAACLWMLPLCLQHGTEAWLFAIDSSKPAALCQAPGCAEDGKHDRMH